MPETLLLNCLIDGEAYDISPLRRDRISYPFATFDCIKFNSDLRHIDVACDIAFLIMALVERLRHDLAAHFLNRYLESTGITCSMSDNGSCYDNAVVESFFSSLKRDRIKRRKYRTRDEARADVFDYIERFYNRKRRHGYVGNISPVQFEKRTMRA